MTIRILLLLTVAMWLPGCSPAPKNIDYGNDTCHYCKMTIVDAQHAAEAVTDKGKVYMFDAIECMVNFLSEQRDMTFAHLLVNDYQQPEALIPAQESYYLICLAIPSPMGAYLSAFASKQDAIQMKAKLGGDVFDWAGVKERLGSSE